MAWRWSPAKEHVLHREEADHLRNYLEQVIIIRNKQTVAGAYAEDSTLVTVTANSEMRWWRG